MHRLLSEDGALYVHLSPHVAYLVRVILDEIFGKSKHQKTIIWKRASCHPCSTRFACIHDQILFYPKRNHRVTPAFEPLSPKDIESRYSNRDPDGRRFTMGDLTGKSLKTANDPRYHFTFHGIRRIWRYTLPTMRELEARGLIYFRPKGVPRKKIYLDQSKGVPPTDVWTDIPQFVSSDARVNFPTQKPERLLERIIRSSSKQGDLVLDAFCGSGTTLVVAEKLGRNWIGIDSGESAIKVTRARLGLLRVGMGGERENLKPYSLYQVGPNENGGNHGQSE